MCVPDFASLRRTSKSYRAHQPGGWISSRRRVQDLPSKGSIWVDPANGRILQTEVKTNAGAATATIRVTYAIDPRLAIAVPVSMIETVEGQRRQRGEATYSDFRRFEVTSRIR